MQAHAKSADQMDGVNAKESYLLLYSMALRTFSRLHPQNVGLRVSFRWVKTKGFYLLLYSMALRTVWLSPRDDFFHYYV